MFKTPLAAALLTAAVFAAPALAAGHGWQVGNDSFHLYYSDLDMNSTAGRAALLARVTAAANRLCRDQEVDRKVCVAETMRGVTARGALRLAVIERDRVLLAAR